MSKNLKNGDKVRYVKEAPEDCGMTIEVNEFVGTYENGIVFCDGHRIPLKGVCDITNCFEKITES